MPEVLQKYKKSNKQSKMTNKIVSCAPNYKQEMLRRNWYLM